MPSGQNVNEAFAQSATGGRLLNCGLLFLIGDVGAWDLSPKSGACIFGEDDVNDRRISTTSLMDKVVTTSPVWKKDGFGIDGFLNTNIRRECETRVIYDHRNEIDLRIEKIHLKVCENTSVSEDTNTCDLIKTSFICVYWSAVSINNEGNDVFFWPNLLIIKLSTHNVCSNRGHRNDYSNEQST